MKSRLNYIVLLVGFIFFLNLSSFSQDYNAEFQDLCKEWDAEKINTLLIDWEKSSPKDVQFLIASFNYHFIESQETMLTMEDEPGKGDNIVGQDSLGNDSFYMFDKTFYNDSLLDIAYLNIDKAIKLYPKRLDLWFGKAYVLGQTENFEEQEKLIIKTIQKGKKIKWKWLWSENKPVEDPQEFFKSSIQDYITTFFDNSEDQRILNISEEMIKVFPKDPISHTNKGIAQIFLNQEKESLETFLYAHSLDEQDIIILFNLAYAQEVNELWTDARNTYNTIIEIGSVEDKEYAKEKLIAIPE